MDPNEVIRRARRAAMAVLEADAETVEADELANAFAYLDAWLVRGGFLPRDWEMATPARTGKPYADA